MSRAIRRHHINRLKAKRKLYWHYNKKTDKELGILSQTPKNCDCWMCKKPKKHTLSFAEEKMFQKGLTEE